jgi:hypothetical protein
MWWVPLMEPEQEEKDVRAVRLFFDSISESEKVRMYHFFQWVLSGECGEVYCKHKPLGGGGIDKPIPSTGEAKAAITGGWY